MDNKFDDMINEFKARARTKRLSFLARRYKKRSFLDKDYDLLESRTIYRKPKKKLERHCRKYLETIELDKRIVRFVNCFMADCLSSTKR